MVIEAFNYCFNNIVKNIILSYIEIIVHNLSFKISILFIIQLYKSSLLNN